MATNKILQIESCENQYFYEDEVYSIDKKGKVKFGLVMENYEAAPSDDEFEDTLKKGEIRVAWHPDGNEEVLNEFNVGLADRTLMPGDVVRRMIPGKDTQRGYCHEIHVTADLKVIGTKYVLKNVSSDRLRPLIPMPRDHAVCLDSWVGSTKDYNQKLVLKTSCDSVLELSVDIDYCPLKDTDTKTRCGLFAGTLFYPGQTLVGPVSELENAKWITTSPEMRTSRKHKTVDRRFVVQSVEMEGVWINWQCKASGENLNGETNEDLILQQPKVYITGENLKRLKRLNLFESCMLQINDKGYVKILESDVLVRKSQWKREQTTKYRLLKNQQIINSVTDTANTNIFNNNNNNNDKSNSISSDNKIKTTITATTELDDLENIKNFNLNLKQLECDKTKLCPNNINIICNLTNENERLNETGHYNNENDDENDVNGKSITAKASNTGNNPNTNSNNAAINENSVSVTSLHIDIRDDDWQTDEDNMDEMNNGSTSDCSTTISSSCSSTATPKGSPKKTSALLADKIRGRIHKKNSKSFISSLPEKVPKVDDEIVTETLVVYSLATVVWQDGTIEHNIPSTELYPIHHLDDHEFFPGDYVLAGSNNDKQQNLSYREYGVIQNVDHQGRTALVKWFSTYTCNSEPVPLYKGESEVSVYDLKDHPDFQYCPGTIVIRVANFVGDDANCTAGQVIDNYPEGRVKVWWVNGHVSMCWPQDLFEVGQYDAENNFWSNADSDNDSWVTEDETSELGDNVTILSHAALKTHLTTNLERARVAMSRLEEMFIINPNLQNRDIMSKLLLVYKKCRYLDRLMNTQYFHEENFLGLIERVRKSEQQSTAERVLDQKHRLFHGSNVACQTSISMVNSNDDAAAPIVGNDAVPTGPPPPPLYKKPKLLNLSLGNDDSKFASMKSPIKKCCVKMSQQQLQMQQQQQQQYSDATKLLTSISCDNNNDSSNYSTISTSSSPSSTTTLTATTTSNNILNSNLNKQAIEVEAELNNVKNLMSLKKGSDDLNSSNNSNFSFASFISSSDAMSSECVSAKLCSLIKIQLHKALNEITERYVPMEMFKEIVLDNTSDNETETESKNNNIKAVDSLLLLRDKLIPEQVSTPTISVDEPINMKMSNPDNFQILEAAPITHKYYLTVFHASNTQYFYKAVQKEHKLLKNSLPPGVWVRTFEDRLDLLSFLIEGPKNTPYENGLFLFDLQLGHDYPRTPPLCHYISYCTDRLNPNLYEDGKVCVSLLGTWSGRGTEIWGSTSTLLQLIVSIQGLILVDEPYFNEAGYEKQRGTQQGKENSRMYNEMVILKLVQSMTKLIKSPSSIFQEHITRHFSECGEAMFTRIKDWMDLSNERNNSKDGECVESETNSNRKLPDFPLIPASRGFCLSLSSLLDIFHKAIQSISSE